MKPFISIIISNHNGKRFIDDCLKTVKNQTYKNFETIFIDSGSTDGSVKYVESKYSWVRLIDVGEKIGHGKCNNIGVQESNGKLIVSLDVDVKLDKDFLSEIVKCYLSHNNVGIIAPKILNFEGEIGSLGEYYSILGFGGDAKTPDIPIIGSPACAMCIDRYVFEEVGGFDEDFFMYMEDIDIGLRVMLAGYDIIHCQKAVVYHYYGGSGMASEKKFYLNTRNNLYIIFKDLYMGQIPLTLFLFFIQRSILTTFLFFKNSSLAKSIIKGIMDFDLVSTIRKRAKIKRFRKLKLLGFMDSLVVLWREQKGLK